MKRIVTREDAIAWFKDQGYIYWPRFEEQGAIGVAGESERVRINQSCGASDDPGAFIDLCHDVFLLRPDAGFWRIETHVGDQCFDSLHYAVLEAGRRITALRRERGRGHDAIAYALPQLRMRGFVVRVDRNWSSSRILVFDAVSIDSPDAGELKRSHAVFGLSFDLPRGNWRINGYREPHRGQEATFGVLYDAIAWLVEQSEGVESRDADGAPR